VKDLVSYLKTSHPRPDFREILIPGESEWRTAQERMREGISIDSSTWDQIVRVKGELSLT
jgi:LDH2 family malate/lactate/ureidoglycolate dehydrogenase